VPLNSLQRFIECYTVREYKKGDVILQQDTEPTCAFIIKEGTVKTYNITSKGEEKPIGFDGKTDFFPLGWIFDKIHKAQYYYEALNDCQLYIVPKRELTEYLHAHACAMREVLDKCVRETLSHQMRINALGQSKASDKVLHTIHYLALCFGRDLRTDIVEIPLPLTQQDVANFTGLTRETISVELKKLATDKVIFSRNRNFVVLTDRMDELLDDGYEHQLVR
jgi:CRP-like cAMP-binding protein